MSAELQQINPFLIPGSEDAPKSPLCPWREADHVKYYVDIESYQRAFALFKTKFTNPLLLRDNSRLALVIGESGCGKSALRNHCAHWLVDQLAAKELCGEIVDLTSEAKALNHGPDGRPLDLGARTRRICEKLLKRLAVLDLISAEDAKSLAETAVEAPSDVYEELASALERRDKGDVVLILLLPSTDLRQEVDRYVEMPGSRIIFFAEAVMSPSELNSINSDHDVTLPPAAVTVGPLTESDVRLFIKCRIEQRAEGGVFPRLAGDLVDQLAASDRPMSVAMLQLYLTGAYEFALQYFPEYTNDTTIGVEGMYRYTLSEWWLRR